MSSRYILFYSRQCVYSKKIIGILNEYPVLNELFDKIAIEDVQNYPKKLKEVPAIGISNQHILQGQEAFDWLAEKVKDSFSSGPEFEKKGNLHYTSLENHMTEMKKNMASFQDVSSFQNGSSFQEVASHESHSIQSGPSKQPVSKKEQDFNSELERFTKERMESLPVRGPPPQVPNFSSPNR